MQLLTAHTALPAAVLVVLMGAFFPHESVAVSAVTTCARSDTAFTSRCENTCFTGRPCVAFSGNVDATTFCDGPLPMAVCRTNAKSGCTFACLKYALDDNVERNLIDYTSFTFLIPFGSHKSEWEAKWTANKTTSASATTLPNLTDQFPSIGDDVLVEIEPLTFRPSTKTLRIAGGTSMEGIQGRVAKIDLSPGVFLDATGLQSLSVANLELKQITPSSFPPQLVNLSLTNCVLSTIPNDLLTMAKLDRLDLSKNYFKSYPAKFSLPSVTYLNVSTNNLESFEASFSALTTLDLSDNLFTSVPSTVFSMATLQFLDLRRNSFTNVELTQPQAAFLTNLSSLLVDSFGNATCSRASQKLIGGATVCVASSPRQRDDGSGDAAANTETKPGSSHTTALIGGIIGGVIAVLLVTAIFVFLRRRRSSSANGTSPSSSNNQNKNKSKTSLSSTATQHSAVPTTEPVHSLWSDQELMSLKVNSDDIQDIRKIGSGAFSVVFLVQYRQTRFAAAKRLKKDDRSWHHTQQFVAEIKLVRQFEHPRVVSLIGVAWTMEADLQALFEYLENGDLRTYVELQATPKLWTREKLQILMDIVEALVYVHSFTPPLVHRDLKSRNVLLDAQNRAKLSDFGVARFRSDQQTMTSGVGTGRWLAPEVISGSNDYDQSCDIFALGVVMAELDTHELPYEDIRGPSGNRLADVALLQMVSVGKLVPTFSRSCPADILKLASRCLAFDRTARPTSVEIAYALRTIMRANGQFV